MHLYYYLRYRFRFPFENQDLRKKMRWAIFELALKFKMKVASKFSHAWCKAFITQVLNFYIDIPACLDLVVHAIKCLMRIVGSPWEPLEYLKCNCRSKGRYTRHIRPIQLSWPFHLPVSGVMLIQLYNTGWGKCGHMFPTVFRRSGSIVYRKLCVSQKTHHLTLVRPDLNSACLSTLLATHCFVMWMCLEFFNFWLTGCTCTLFFQVGPTPTQVSTLT